MANKSKLLETPFKDQWSATGMSVLLSEADIRAVKLFQEAKELDCVISRIANQKLRGSLVKKGLILRSRFGWELTATGEAACYAQKGDTIAVLPKGVTGFEP